MYILTNMTTLNIRIDKKTKKTAGKTLSKLGLDMSTAVKIFLHQVVSENGLPFTPTKNPSLIRAKWDKEIKSAKKGRSYKSSKEAIIAALR